MALLRGQNLPSQGPHSKPIGPKCDPNLSQDAPKLPPGGGSERPRSKYDQAALGSNGNHLRESPNEGHGTNPVALESDLPQVLLDHLQLTEVVGGMIRNQRQEPAQGVGLRAVAQLPV